MDQQTSNPVLNSISISAGVVSMTVGTAYPALNFVISQVGAAAELGLVVQEVSQTADSNGTVVYSQSGIQINGDLLALTATAEEILLGVAALTGVAVSAPLSLSLGMGLAIAATIAANQSTISDPAFYEAISKSISSVSLDPLLNYINRPQSNVIESIKQTYTDSKAITSPIILDLDGDGIETTAVGSGTWFDHDANGFAESTGWAGSDDGILVRDLDGNGTIDSGRELFGSETLLANGQKAANGFQALAELDSNLDGKIDASDAAYTTLNIWKDVDGDGTTDAGELLTLAEAGVQSLNVGYTASTAIDANGNQHQQIGSYTTTTGTTRAAEDVWFKVDKLNTLAEDWIAVSADIAVLPDVTGYGNVYDLHQAMARDTANDDEWRVTV